VEQYWPAGFEDSRMQGPDLERLDPPFQFSHVDAESSFSPRATMTSIPSGNGR
jgi:hypothetical protein